MAESFLEMARRHIIEAEVLCAAQAREVREIIAAGRDTAEAEELLALMEETLTVMRFRLALMEAKTR